jgi:hypothetical protein
VVIELEPEQVHLIGRPIPACEGDPIPRSEQAHKMANFLAGLNAASPVPEIAVRNRPMVISDPAFAQRGACGRREHAAAAWPEPLPRRRVAYRPTPLQLLEQSDRYVNDDGPCRAGKPLPKVRAKLTLMP